MAELYADTRQERLVLEELAQRPMSLGEEIAARSVRLENLLRLKDQFTKIYQDMLVLFPAEI